MDADSTYKIEDKWKQRRYRKKTRRVGLLFIDESAFALVC